MIQRQKKHPAGTFPACRECGQEPRHFAIGGGIATASGSASTTRHMLECRCGQTGRFPALDAAVRDWRTTRAESQRIPGVLTLHRQPAKTGTGAA